MRKIFLFSLLCFISVKVLCQSDTLHLKNQIQFSPLRVIDLVNPGFEVSYERFFSSNYSTQLSLAYMADPFHITPFNKVKGYRIGLEEKYFIKKKTKARNYISTDFIFYHVNFNNITQGIKMLADSSEEVYNNINHLVKYTATINVKYGMETFLNNHLILDVSFGLGVRYFNVKSLSQPDPDFFEPVRKTVFIDLYELASTPDHYFTINIPFNIKIGYRF